MKQHKRKMCICSNCNKEKAHFGKGMCSACLRNYKRKTKPIFYLGTCFSEMSRRVKTFDIKRPNYFGLEICTKSEFISLFLTDINFLKLYKNWQNNNYLRKYAPSIDRIDNIKGYVTGNLRFISHAENTGKDFRIAIILKNKNKEHSFKSCRDVAKFFGISPSYFCRIKKHKGQYRGYKIYENT